MCNPPQLPNLPMEFSMTSKVHFPGRPADVTCESCPYYQKSSWCSRNANGHETSLVDWCGEHPWFAAQRDKLQAEALGNALNDVLYDRFHDLALKLNK